jgi:hypothetical protein
MFSRSIGGAIGVATMGAVLATELSAHLGEIAPGGAADPNQLMNAAARASMAPEALAALEGVLAAALRDVFWMGAIAAALGLLSSFWIPARLSGRHTGPH